MRRRCVLVSGLTPAALAAALLLASCGGGSSSTPTSPTTPGTPGTPGTPTVTTTITITAAGVSPKDIQVSPGARVTFVNNDTRAHQMSSDPHPDHTDCSEINQVGLLTPGARKETGNLNTARTCGFHDHDLPAVANLTGTIVIR
ncbi:MAG: hypothetical protein NUW22_08185 [Acidobacteria bacterium]|nr:hypothetical protein [Acidobacteriota bacterium]